MKRILVAITVFASTFLLGMSAALLFISANTTTPTQIGSVIDSKLESAPILFDEVAEYDSNVDYARELPVKMIEPGVYLKEDAPFRSGESWVGLFRIGEEYVLKKTTIAVKQVNDGRDVEVSIRDKQPVVFLLKNARDLYLGEVSTNIDRSRELEYDPELPRTFPMSFRIRGHWWNLSIVNAPDSVLRKGSALVLEKDQGVDTRVLRQLNEDCDDCSWEVLWAGDLDGDDQIDLLIDVTDHYNVLQPTLFLSSKGIYASYRNVGC